MSSQQRVVAKNTTLRGSAVKAGTPVDDLDPEPSKEWLEDAKKTGLVETVTVEPEPEPNSGAGGDGDGEPGYKDEQGNFIPLKSLKVPELKEIAKDSEIEGYAQMSKDQLIEAIAQNSETPEGDGEPGFQDEHGNFVPLSSLEVPALQEIAKDAEIEDYAQMDKDQLIEAIASNTEPVEGGEQ